MFIRFDRVLGPSAIWTRLSAESSAAAKVVTDIDFATINSGPVPNRMRRTSIPIKPRRESLMKNCQNPGEMELDWPAPDRAGGSEYRLVLHDLQGGGYLYVRDDRPRFVVPTDLIDPSHEYEWKIQQRDALGAPWRNLSPYLILPRPTPTLETQTLFVWPDRGAPAYRLVLVDLTIGEFLVKAGIRGTEYVLDSSILDLRHVYHYRLQAWFDEGWTSVTPYIPLPRVSEGDFERRILVKYRNPQSFNRVAFGSLAAHRLQDVRLETGWIATERLRSVSPIAGIDRAAIYLANHPDSGEGILKAFQRLRWS